MQNCAFKSTKLILVGLIIEKSIAVLFIILIKLTENYSTNQIHEYLLVKSHK